MDDCVDITTAFTEDAPELWRYSVNLRTQEVVATLLTPDARCDFPVVPSDRVGLPARYCYCSRSAEQNTDMCAFVSVLMLRPVPLPAACTVPSALHGGSRPCLR